MRTRSFVALSDIYNSFYKDSRLCALRIVKDLFSINFFCRELYICLMQANLLLVTPPFTQLNTAYPATSYIKGFLEEKEVSVSHFDLSIELFTSVFTSRSLRSIFQEALDLENHNYPLLQERKELYISSIDVVIFQACPQKRGGSQTSSRLRFVSMNGFRLQNHKVLLILLNLTI